MTQATYTHETHPTYSPRSGTAVYVVSTYDAGETLLGTRYVRAKGPDQARDLGLEWGRYVGEDQAVAAVARLADPSELV